MAITASFDADFSAFSSEVQKAEKDLLQFEGKTTDTAQAIGRMGTVSTTTVGPVNSLQDSFRQFDGALAAVGIHIGPAMRGLEDLAAASGKTATQIGLLGTAGLAVGAAMAGWKIGRAIADFAGLDDAIARGTASLLGWGSVVQQTAGANLDVLQLASMRAERSITDLSEAIRINQKWVDDHKKAALDAAKAYDTWKKATDDVNIATQNWGAVLDTIDGKVVEGAKDALAMGASQKAVADSYGLTAPQIAAVVSALAAEQAAIKASDAEHKKITDDLKKYWDEVLAKRDQVFGKDALVQADQWVKAIHALGGSLDAFTNDQLRALVTTMNTAIDAMTRSGTLTQAESADYFAVAQAAQAALNALQPLVTVTDNLAQSEYDLAVAHDNEIIAASRAEDAANALTTARQAATAAAKADREYMLGTAAFPSGASLTAAGRTPGSFLGGMGTGQAFTTPTPIYAQPWQPFAVAAGAGTTINVSGSVISTQNELAALVQDAIMQAYRKGGNLLPV